MNTETILPIDRNSIVERSKHRQEPQWMTDLRVEGLELAGSLELPILEKTKIDRWNLQTHGTLTSINDSVFEYAIPEYAKALLEEDGNANDVIIQRNANVVHSQISEQLLQKGVIFTDILTALREHEELVKKYFMKAIRKEEHRLSALHTALWNGGIFLYVPRNVQVEVPLQAIYLTDDKETIYSPHIIIVAEELSSVTYVDNYLSSDDIGEQLLNGVVEVFVKPGAHVQFASVHHLNESVTDITYRRAIVEKDGRMNWIVGELNNGNGVSDTTSVLKGDGSFSDAKVLCVGTGSQKLNLTTRAIHFGRSSSSDMITRAVMRDESTAIINGVTKIEKGATGADGQQTEKVLMLSPKSRGDANPILLIDEDDVTAGHAASVGQVNPDQVHYLMSRGISKKQAQRLIINGFLAPVVAEIPITKLENQLQKLVERKLGQ